MPSPNDTKVSLPGTQPLGLHSDIHSGARRGVCHHCSLRLLYVGEFVLANAVPWVLTGADVEVKPIGIHPAPSHLPFSALHMHQSWADGADGECAWGEKPFLYIFFKFRAAFEPSGKYLQTNHPFFCFPSSTTSKTEGLHPAPFVTVRDSIRLSQGCLSRRIPASQQGRGAVPAPLAARHRLCSI